MPTISALALGRLLDTKPTSADNPPPPTGLHTDASSISSVPPWRRRGSPQPCVNHPALYAAPDSSSHIPLPLPPQQQETRHHPLSNLLAQRGRTVIEESAGGRRAEGQDSLDDRLAPVKGEEEEEEEEDFFFDPPESMSVASSSEAEDGGSSHRNGFRSRTSLQNQSDFYDAAQDFLSHGSVTQSSPSFNLNLETELHTLRVTLLEEIERRERAEKALLQLNGQWHRMASCLSQVGLSFPKIQQDDDVQLETDPDSLCQEIVVARLVSEAVERGIARAEAAEIAEAVIDSKNHEISRLKDRLQFYEAVNREMSQRNQEIIEITCQKHLRRRTRQKWLWSCIGLSITVGASVLAYSYLPQFADKDPSPTSCPDAAASFSQMESGKK